ncbi:MAG: hypothetical protein KGZ58_09045 [Ignavibacteriales bacterium]|nr:hypothetical protein [Ignavibacteriales bacterium]
MKLCTTISLIVFFTTTTNNLFAQHFIQSSTAETTSVFSFEMMIGDVSSTTKNAIENFQDTKFKGKGMYGLEAKVRFPSGFVLALAHKKFSMTLTENKDELGMLNMNETVVSIGYQRYPSGGNGVGSHVFLGFGSNSPSFDKGTFLTALELIYPVEITVQVEPSFIFEMDGGIDFFFNEKFSAFLGYTLSMGNVGTGWIFSGDVATIQLPEANTFLASNGQLKLGVCYWFVL